MAALGQFYVSSMAALGQFYVSSMAALGQFVLCQFYVRGYAPGAAPVWLVRDSLSCFGLLASPEPSDSRWLLAAAFGFARMPL